MKIVGIEGVGSNHLITVLAGEVFVCLSGSPNISVYGATAYNKATSGGSTKTPAGATACNKATTGGSTKTPAVNTITVSSDKVSTLTFSLLRSFQPFEASGTITCLQSDGLHLYAGDRDLGDIHVIDPENGCAEYISTYSLLMDMVDYWRSVESFQRVYFLRTSGENVFKQRRFVAIWFQFHTHIHRISFHILNFIAANV